ncbi:nucleoside hydrolase [Sphingomonas sp. LH128]|uniref:nucleoside hydrolase n=1 Tax=Sphingomonas sp. LH128 TaxID=473781 RepID=UPI00055F1EFD|nr:nucleoside hydrolase [Sphingomonas sp. LH128]
MAAGVLMQAVPSPSVAVAKGTAPELVIFDNDFCEITPVLPLLSAPNVRVIGLTTVTGDCWSEEATLATLSDLEVIGRTEIPVASGAMYPLVNTPDRMAAAEPMRGALAWKGAWNAADESGRYHPDDPHAYGLPAPLPRQTKAVAQSAAAFLVRMVREHPHQVTIYAAGPMTNIALAIRLDPEIPKLAKALVFDGGHIRAFDAEGESDADFNFAFDPEAAHVVLSAPWSGITSVGDLADAIVVTPDLLARIDAQKTVLSAYALRRLTPGMPLWDAVGAAIIADPSLVAAARDLAMDVDIAEGLFYGRARVWSAGRTPPRTARRVRVIEAVDRERLERQYVASLAPGR